MIRKSLTGIDNMSDREFDYLKTTRKFYGTGALLALEKAIAPEKHRQQTLVLTWGNQGFQVIDDNVLELVGGEEDEQTPE